MQPDKAKDVPKMDAVTWQPKTDRGLDKHTENFIDVVKKKNKSLLNCPIEAGARVAINSHMATIAYRTGETIFWDPAANKFAQKKANQLIRLEFIRGGSFRRCNDSATH